MALGEDQSSNNATLENEKSKTKKKSDADQEKPDKDPTITKKPIKKKN